MVGYIDGGGNGYMTDQDYRDKAANSAEPQDPDEFRDKYGYYPE
jgi:hypothetical protein